MFGKYVSPLGVITFGIQDGKLNTMVIDDLDVVEDLNADISHVKEQLSHYFNHQLQSFDVEIDFKQGTSFQKQVWHELLKIPYGETRSYFEIAQAINHPKAVRAVGQACKKNPIGIIVPCHRVIGKNGSLTGYSGKNFLDLKAYLLKLEKRMKYDQ